MAFSNHDKIDVTINFVTSKDEENLKVEAVFSYLLSIFHLRLSLFMRVAV